MAEGVAVGGRVLGGAVHDDPSSRPEPSEDAPRGWTWIRASRSWQPKRRGQILWRPAAAAERDADSAQGDPDRGTWDEGAAPPQRDPGPAWAREDDSPPGAGKRPEVPQNVKDDIAGFAGLIGTPILAMLRAADPYCGRALAQGFEGIVDATLPLLCRSEKIVRYFSDDSNDWLLWGKLAMALAPVGKAFVEHHITHAVELREVLDESTGEPTGEIVVVRKGHEEEQPETLVSAPPDYSAYAAA